MLAFRMTDSYVCVCLAYLVRIEPLLPKSSFPYPVSLLLNTLPVTLVSVRFFLSVSHPSLEIPPIQKYQKPPSPPPFFPTPPLPLPFILFPFPNPSPPPPPLKFRQNQ